MTEAATIKDRYGLQMSTSSVSAAEHYTEGVDRLLEQGYGAEEGFVNAIEADEGFALAHGGLALMLMLRGQLVDAKASAERAKLLSSGITRRERQHIEAISLYINNRAHESLALIREHLKDYPRDAMMLRLANRLFVLGCSGAF